MRFTCFCLFVISLFSATAVAQTRITVVDPQGAVVSGARVTVLDGATFRTIALQTTSGDGVATFANLPAGEYRLEVLAPGFARARLTFHAQHEIEVEVKLTVAVTPQTVVTTATLLPVPEEESGALVSSLDDGQLIDMQPIAVSEALRFLPGVVVSNAGQRGGQTSLFVRGGESRYNKVIIDGVPVNDPGGFFDFGVVPMQEVERLEMLRGPGSTLYGSDAMTSVVQLWTATGRTRVPELRFGAEGGNLSTARGFASLAGARGRFDYNLFADQVNTDGQGVNDQYSNASQGANVGVVLSPLTFLRIRVRHSNNRSGAQNAWKFNGVPLLAPDIDQFARQNNLIGSVQFTVSAPAQWQHRFSGYAYNHRRLNVDSVPDRGCDFAKNIFRDCGFSTYADFNRTGFEYQGDYTPLSWARTTFGYSFEDEHGDTRDLLFGGASHGLRRNHALYGQELLVWSRVSLTAGLRYVHNESFGNKAVPHLAATWLLRRGGERLSGTRLRAAFGQGIKAPDFLEAFGNPAFRIIANPDLKAEENRSLEAGVEQAFWDGRFSLGATYYNNLFHNRVAFKSLGAPAFQSQFININRALAHGVEAELHARLPRGLALQGSYVYTATQVLEAPLAKSTVGTPLLRRPRHLGTMLVTYFGKRWGGDVGGSFVGRRPDSDFQGFNIDHAAGYARVDFGGWFAINRYSTAYLNVENLLDKNYNEVLGFPSLGATFRTGMRFRIGGE